MSSTCTAAARGASFVVSGLGTRLVALVAIILAFGLRPALHATPPDPNRPVALTEDDASQARIAGEALPLAAVRTVGKERTNLGPVRDWRFEGHVLTPADAEDGTGGLRVLYAPSEADDPLLREQLTAVTGGITDYFDTRAATPSVGLLLEYDAVLVWTNFGHFDPVAYGDALAAASTKGTLVVLGAFCTYDLGNSLLGQIRAPGFSPVANPSGGNFFVVSSWAGQDCGFGWYDGIDVGGLNRVYRDTIVLQGPGIACGRDSNEEQTPTAAYNDPGADSWPVVVANGAGGAPLGNPPDTVVWVGQIIVNGVGAGGGPVDCACDAVFSVGDRVVRTADSSGDGPVLGSTGTVLSAADPKLFEPIWMLVAWDDFVGHDGLGYDACPPNPAPGNGWYVRCQDLDLRASVGCQCDGVYAVGDRVVLLESGGGPAAGSTGTVFSGADPQVFSNLILVGWDGFAGHDGNGFDFCPPNPTPDNGWWVDCAAIARLGSGIVFDPPVAIGDITEPRAIGATDFDGVNGNDVMVPILAPTPGQAGAVAVFLNDGTGVGFERVLTQVGADPSGVAWGEYDGVNGPDAAVTNAGDDTVSILLNDGSGKGTFVTSQVIPVGPTPSAIDKGDADGDGDLDLIVTHLGDGTAVLLRNTEGFFTADTPFFVGNGPRSVRFASFSQAPGPGEGLDFAVASSDDGTVDVYENDGAGGYAKASSIPVGGTPTTLDPEDIDRDKDTDMAVGGCDTEFVTVITSDGAGGFTTTEVEAGTCPSSLDVADVDGDGDNDIVVVSETDGGGAGGSANGVVVKGAKILENLLEKGSVQFELAGEPLIAEGLGFVFLSQLDGDERIDIIGASSVDGVGTVTVVTNATQTIPGDVNGDGVVDVSDLLAVLSAWGPCPIPPLTCPADLDGDGTVGVGDLLEVLGNWF